MVLQGLVPAAADVAVAAAAAIASLLLSLLCLTAVKRISKDTVTVPVAFAVGFVFFSCRRSYLSSRCASRSTTTALHSDTIGLFSRHHRRNSVINTAA